MWNFRKPNVKHLKVFGCLAHRLIRKENRENKYAPVTSEGVLVGYTDDNFNFKIYDLKSRKIIITNDVTFFEDIFPFRGDSPSPDDVLKLMEEENIDRNEETSHDGKDGQLQFNGDSDHTEEVEEGQIEDSVPRDSRELILSEEPSNIGVEESDSPEKSSESNPLRRTAREKPNISYKGMGVEPSLSIASCFSILGREFEAAIVEIETPKSYKGAMQSP